MPVNVQLLSDLHLEHIEHHHCTNLGRSVEDFFDTLDPSGVDVLVLAGDITSSRRLRTDLAHFCDLYPQVVYLPGNHEYYGTSWAAVDQALADVGAKNPNFHLLMNTAITVSGVRFVGGTLWFPKPDNTTRARGGIYMNDFNLIGAFEPRVYDEHKQCVAALEAYLAEADVVVTHHLPAHACTAPVFKDSPLDHFFCHDMTPLIEKHQPPLWLYGHTHCRMDNHIGKTRLVANPLGYPTEAYKGYAPFNPKLVFEVEPKG